MSQAQGAEEREDQGRGDLSSIGTSLEGHLQQACRATFPRQERALPLGESRAVMGTMAHKYQQGCEQVHTQIWDLK